VTVEFVRSGRGAAQCPPNPEYPNGIHVNAGETRRFCMMELPYPAPECGMWRIECGECGLIVMLTAVGRADDPVTVRMPCNLPAI
jgi:hypothetical protein